MYDYEYSSVFLEKLLDESFNSTPGKIFENISVLDKFMIDLWNGYIAFNRVLKISINNLSLVASRNVMDGEPHRANSVLQEYGMDAFTLSLRLGLKSDSTFSVLSDYAKVLILAFRLAEANERAVESTFFTYLIANKKFCTLKDVIVLIGFVSFALIFLYVDLLGTSCNHHNENSCEPKINSSRVNHYREDIYTVVYAL
jgi:hypothetical protein